MSQDREMEAFKQEMRKEMTQMSGNFLGLSKELKEMTGSIHELATNLRLSEEREKHQNGINKRMGQRMEVLEDKVEQINLNRAKEQQSREFLMKHWPWLLVVMALIIAFASSIFSTMGRQIVG